MAIAYNKNKIDPSAKYYERIELYLEHLAKEESLS